MTEFECSVRVRIVAADGATDGESLMVLPFAPYPGLGILAVQPPGGVASEVLNVDWDPVEQSFVIYLESDLTADSGGMYPSLEQRKAAYGKEWTWVDEAKT